MAALSPRRVVIAVESFIYHIFLQFQVLLVCIRYGSGGRSLHFVTVHINGHAILLFNAPSSTVSGKGLIGVSDIGLIGLIQGQFFAPADIVNPVRI